MTLALGVSGATVATQAHTTAATRAAPALLEAPLRASGDPDGAGEAHFRLSKARQRVCANVESRCLAT
uniref:hypothetical protein n=1 Tax=Nocardioides sp. TaxID=35761 RepID=UPI00286E38B2